jgi:hypothetical protein
MSKLLPLDVGTTSSPEPCPLEPRPQWQHSQSFGPLLLFCQFILDLAWKLYHEENVVEALRAIIHLGVQNEQQTQTHRVHCICRGSILWSRPNGQRPVRKSLPPFGISRVSRLVRIRLRKWIWLLQSLRRLFELRSLPCVFDLLCSACLQWHKFVCWSWIHNSSSCRTTGLSRISTRDRSNSLWSNAWCQDWLLEIANSVCVRTSLGFDDRTLGFVSCASTFLRCVQRRPFIVFEQSRIVRKNLFEAMMATS